MKLNSHNEWDKLQEIIVGRGESKAGLIFENYTGLGSISRENLEKAEKLAKEAYPDWLVNEINEDLEELAGVARKFGAKVFRPDNSDVHKPFATPTFAASAEHAYNARDLYLVVGDTVIESPSQEKHRYFEAQAYYDILYGYFKEGSRWIAGPKPKLKGEYKIPYYEDEKLHIKLTEDEILFEAANTVRMGKDLLYLVSKSGNYLGAQWLQSMLGNEYRVHTTDRIYKSSHIDSTALCLRPGLVLMNAYRVNDGNLPKIFEKWDKIYFSDITPYPVEMLDFHRNVRVRIYSELKKLGFETGLNSISSEWIGMNILSLDPNTAVVDKRQTGLIKTLEQHKITVIPISFRHSYYMGGIHCSTLDTVRESRLESYCD